MSEPYDNPFLENDQRAQTEERKRDIMPSIIATLLARWHTARTNDSL